MVTKSLHMALRALLPAEQSSEDSLLVFLLFRDPAHGQFGLPGRPGNHQKNHDFKIVIDIFF